MPFFNLLISSHHPLPFFSLCISCSKNIRLLMVSYSVRNFYSKIRLEEIKKIEKTLYIPTFSLFFNTTFSFNCYHICLHFLHLYCLPIFPDAIPTIVKDAALSKVVILCILVDPHDGHLGFNVSTNALRSSSLTNSF